MYRGHRTNPRQLVLRRDKATGLTLVGWDVDLPPGRFEHLALICEPVHSSLQDMDSEEHAAYQSAMRHAQQANISLVEQRVSTNQSRGWYAVPFELAKKRDSMVADEVGNYAAAAMQLHFQLSGHCKRVWAVIRDGKVVHVRARYPKQALDELTEQVWYFRQLQELQAIEGELLQGVLIVCLSGLWLNTAQD